MSGYFYNNLDRCKEVPSVKILSRRLADLCRPKEAFYGTENIDYEKSFKRFEPKSLLNGAKTVVFKRTYALGDILTCVPVVRQMRDVYGVKNVIFETGYRHSFDKTLFGDMKFTTEYKNLDYNIAIDADHVFEQDHDYKNDKSYWSRLKILQDFLGLPFDKNLDWSYDKTEDVPEIPKNCICVSVFSTTIQRRMNEATVPLIFDLIASMGFVPFSMNPIKKYKDGKCLELTETLNVRQAISLLAKCKALVTIDTGTLWFNHFARIPMVGLFGSTRAEEKLDYFPNPEKCVGIDMRKYVGCDVFCRGNGDYCLKTAPCFNEFDKDEFLSDLEKALNILKVGK